MAPTTTTTTTATTRSPSIGFTLQNGKHFANILLPRLYSDIVLHTYSFDCQQGQLFPTLVLVCFLYAYTPPCALVCTFLIYCNALKHPTPWTFSYAFLYSALACFWDTFFFLALELLLCPPFLLFDPMRLRRILVSCFLFPAPCFIATHSLLALDPGLSRMRTFPQSTSSLWRVHISIASRSFRPFFVFFFFFIFLLLLLPLLLLLLLLLSCGH